MDGRHSARAGVDGRPSLETVVARRVGRRAARHVGVSVGFIDGSGRLPKRFGWGIHADEQGRIALYGVDSSEYATLAAGSTPDGRPVTVTAAMRSRR